MTATARLNELLAGPQPGLDRVLTVIASTDDPDNAPSEDEVIQHLDGLADGCPADSGPDEVLDYVYGTLNFTGDMADYYSPENSLIHRVLERRRGIPLTLAAVACEIARRRAIDLRPIGMPGHILLGEGPEPSQWYDPFNRGARLGLDDCRLLFARFHPVEAFAPSMLNPIGVEAVAIRTLNNLRIAYAKRGQATRTIPVLELRAGMDSAEIGDRLELASVLAELGRFDRAAEEFEQLAEQDPERGLAYLTKARTYRAHRN